METIGVLESHTGYWLRRVSNHVSGAFARALQTRQVSVAEWVVLCQVQARSGCTPGEVAEALGLTRGAVSKIMDKLEAKGWLSSSVKKDDARVQLLSLTRQGERILPALAALADENDRHFFNVLDAREKAALRRILGKLAAAHHIQEVPLA